MRIPLSWAKRLVQIDNEKPRLDRPASQVGAEQVQSLLMEASARNRWAATLELGMAIPGANYFFVGVPLLTALNDVMQNRPPTTPPFVKDPIRTGALPLTALTGPTAVVNAVVQLAGAAADKLQSMGWEAIDAEAAKTGYAPTPELLELFKPYPSKS
jgi:hypothetical protein